MSAPPTKGDVMRAVDSGARGLSEKAAAEYLGLSVSGLHDWRRKGIVPGPIPGTHRYDRKAIDAALDKLSGLPTTAPSAYDEWKARQDARAA